MADKKLTPQEIAQNLEIVRHVPAWMRVRGLKRADLVNKLGTSEGTISKWLSGKQTMNARQFAALAEVLGISKAELLSAPGDTEGVNRQQAYHKIIDVAESLQADEIEAWVRMGKGIIATRK